MRPASSQDCAIVADLLGRTPKTDFEVAVRSNNGTPVVVRNAPFEHDGTPMPTRYWLLPSSRAASAIGRLESLGGVRRAETEIEPKAIQSAHDSYAHERNADIPEGWNGPRPSGGVGGTRRGLKCLHAHYAHWLAGGTDAVGAWVWEQLEPGERDDRSVRAETVADHPSAVDHPSAADPPSAVATAHSTVSLQ